MSDFMMVNDYTYIFENKKYQKIIGRTIVGPKDIYVLIKNIF